MSTCADGAHVGPTQHAIATISMPPTSTTGLSPLTLTQLQPPTTYPSTSTATAIHRILPSPPSHPYHSILTFTLPNLTPSHLTMPPFNCHHHTPIPRPNLPMQHPSLTSFPHPSHLLHLSQTFPNPSFPRQFHSCTRPTRTSRSHSNQTSPHLPFLTYLSSFLPLLRLSPTQFLYPTYLSHLTYPNLSFLLHPNRSPPTFLNQTELLHLLFVTYLPPPPPILLLPHTPTPCLHLAALPPNLSHYLTSPYLYPTTTLPTLSRYLTIFYLPPLHAHRLPPTPLLTPRIHYRISHITSRLPPYTRPPPHQHTPPFSTPTTPLCHGHASSSYCPRYQSHTSSSCRPRYHSHTSSSCRPRCHAHASSACRPCRPSQASAVAALAATATPATLPTRPRNATCTPTTQTLPHYAQRTPATLPRLSCSHTTTRFLDTRPTHASNATTPLVSSHHHAPS
ncbi:hypothetical protein Pcinc_031991 [Petrolisthes cinctipes]|uniref:Uncharacterized protein n=1 Tax=Petrolisthes cinctipes TaxID=88211 RepID=A0AAE1EVC0_PETCI|nr:hypothetical protein Pcinc_031991 [Petrolisthes cinctipes]